MTGTIPLPTPDDILFYRENGYWLAPAAVPGETLRRVIRHMDQVLAGTYETGRAPIFSAHEPDASGAVRKIDNAHWADNTIRELVLDEAIGRMAAMLAETPAVRLWHDQLLYKPGGGQREGSIGWHQDYGYWQCTQPADMLTAWIALVDVDEHNGCMQFVPGSHKWGLLGGNLDFFSDDRESQLAAIRRLGGREAEPVNIALAAGQVSFHHCLLLHGSGPNMSDGPRRSLVVHMMPDHIRRRTGTRDDAHANCRLFAGAEGELWRGARFPVIARLA